MDKSLNCQIPSVPRVSEGLYGYERMPLFLWGKRILAKPWNYDIKPYLKRMRVLSLRFFAAFEILGAAPKKHAVRATTPSFVTGDWVRVRSKAEIRSTLDTWKELKGCAFIDDMWAYCGTVQQVMKPMERFLDERDYKVKKCKGIILLNGVMCRGTLVFGTCDRSCHLFWREEWLERISSPVDEEKPDGLASIERIL